MPGVKGNSGGKKGRSGRKSKAEEAGLEALLNKCWTQADREKCIKRLAALANNGEMEPIKLLMGYTFGKPVEHKKLSGDDAAPLKVLVEYVGAGKDAHD